MPGDDPVTGERVDTYLGYGYASKRNAVIAKAKSAAAKSAEAYARIVKSIHRWPSGNGRSC